MPERSRDRFETAYRRIDVMPLRGQFSFTDQAIDALEALLPTYRSADGSHEGIAFLCGLELPTATLYTTAIAPQADHGRRHVRCSETEVAAVSGAARELGLGLLAQVHTHPGDGTIHSFGDDEMVLMPFEGMLSIVCPLYGRFALRPLESLGVHQFQDGTLAYHAEHRADDRPVVIVFGESADSAPGHLLLTSLANQLARAHRRLVFVGDLNRALKCTDVFGLETLEAATVGLARAINPFIDATAERERPVGEALVTLGVGADAELMLGCDRWIAHMGTSATVESSATSMLGAALASVIGSAVAFHRAIGHNALPHGSYSAWEYGVRDGAQGPALVQPIDVGRVLQAGAGAVGCALDYWLAFLGVAGAWMVVDGDDVEVNNLNRQLLFLAADAGFPAGSARKKSDVSAERLGGGWLSLPHWYDAQEAEEARTGVFDLVLPLANERGIRPLLQGRAQTVLLHATTTPNWTALAHRHVAGHDDCIVCRLPAEDEPIFTCSTGTVGEEVRVDASLPFLSAAAGVLLLADIVRLQLGRLIERPANFGSLDLRTPEPFVRQLHWECRDNCSMWLPAVARLRMAEGHRFGPLDSAFVTR